MARSNTFSRNARAAVIALGMVAAAAPLAQAAPLGAATFSGAGAVAVEPSVETVSWRGRRNTALVAGALGLTALGIAAAASQPRYGYGYGYGYEPYGYGYQPSYGYGYGYAPRYRPVDDYGYGYAPVRPRYRYVEEEVYVAPRRSRRVAQPYYHDYGRGFTRGKDPAGN